MEFMVHLNKIDDVKKFVKIASRYDTNILVSNKDRNFVVDASSLMGIFSLDLSNPVVVIINDNKYCKLFKDDVRRFCLCYKEL